jgi:hypothetical protein
MPLEIATSFINPDGLLDLYIQRETPGKEKESN